MATWKSLERIGDEAQGASSVTLDKWFTSHDLGPLSAKHCETQRSEEPLTIPPSCFLLIVPLLCAWTWGAKLSFTLVGFVVSLEKAAAEGDFASFTRSVNILECLALN